MTSEPPHLYTYAEWAGMDRTQRRLVREHRRRAVEWAHEEHIRRYRPRHRLDDLGREVALARGRLVAAAAALALIALLIPPTAR